MNMSVNSDLGMQVNIKHLLLKVSAIVLDSD